MNSYRPISMSTAGPGQGQGAETLPPPPPMLVRNDERPPTAIASNKRRARNHYVLLSFLVSFISENSSWWGIMSRNDSCYAMVSFALLETPLA